MAKNKPKAKAKPTKPPPKGTKGKGGGKAKPKKAETPAVRPGKVDWAAPEMLAVYDRETTRESAQFETEIEALKKDWDTKKESALTAKKNYESKRTELEEYVKDRETGRGKPPASTGSLFSSAEAAEREKEMKKKQVELERENAELRKRLDNEAKNRKIVKDIVAGVAGSTAMPTTADDAPKDRPKGEEFYPEDLFKRVPIAKFKAWGLTDNDVKILVSGDMKDNRPAFPMPKLGDVNAFSSPDPKSGYQRRMTDLKGFGQASIDRWDKAHEGFWKWWDNSANRFEFARECGYDPDTFKAPTAAKPDAPIGAEPAKAEATATGKKLRGGGAKPKAEPKPAKGKKGAKADGPVKGNDGDGGESGDGPPREPGRDEHGFPTSYSDPEPESGEDGEGEEE